MVSLFLHLGSNGQDSIQLVSSYFVIINPRFPINNPSPNNNIFTVLPPLSHVLLIPFLPFQSLDHSFLKARFRISSKTKRFTDSTFFSSFLFYLGSPCPLSLSLSLLSGILPFITFQRQVNQANWHQPFRRKRTSTYNFLLPRLSSRWYALLGSCSRCWWSREGSSHRLSTSQIKDLRRAHQGCWEGEQV